MRIPPPPPERPLDLVVNETAARQFWSGRSPLGHTLTLLGKTFTVVGVARDTKYESLGEAPLPAVWPTLRMGVMSAPTFYVRARTATRSPSSPPSATSCAKSTPTSRSTKAAPSPNTSTTTSRSNASARISSPPSRPSRCSSPPSASTPSSPTPLPSAAAKSASASPSARHPAASCSRSCAKASPSSPSAPPSAGRSAFTLGWYLRPKLIGVPVGDPLIYLGVPALLLAVATLACYLPARRAAKVDPMIALRSE